MLTINEAFDKFRRRQELSQTEQNDASRRQKEIRNCIGEEFEVDRDFLTGSYARHTKIKPLKDVDIFFVLGSSEKFRRQKHPSQILNAIEVCLVKEYGSDQVERGRRCITVYFDKRNQSNLDLEEGKVLSIDVVPAFAVGNHYEIPDNIIGEWIKTNPTVHKEQSTEKNKSLNGNWVPLVKMLKCWNRQNGKLIKPSFLIEVMAIDLVDPEFNNYPDEVRRFFAAAIDEIENNWPDPAGYGPPVSDQMTQSLCEKAKQELRNAEKSATRAYRAESQGRQGEALQIWREVLGPNFPIS